MFSYFSNYYNPLETHISPLVFSSRFFPSAGMFRRSTAAPSGPALCFVESVRPPPRTKLYDHNDIDDRSSGHGVGDGNGGTADDDGGWTRKQKITPQKIFITPNRTFWVELSWHYFSTRFLAASDWPRRPTECKPASFRT